MTYDEAHHQVVMFGGYGQNDIVFDDTWLYSTRGDECTNGTSCETGFCVDGACCQVPSCGTCQACAGAAPGTCSAVENATDPDSCTGAQSCDASGTCRAANGQTCSAATACASGFCVDGVCCDSACDGLCQSCSAASNVGGVSGTCGDVKSGLDPRNICPTDATRSCNCDGKGACRIYAPGTSCGPSACDDNRAAGLVCDGLGARSESAAGVDCTPYVCAIGAGTCIASCTSDDECTEGNACVSRKCVAQQTGVAFCDGDHTITSSSGGSTDCSPYKCAGTTCRSSCDSIADCVGGTVCDTNRTCVMATGVSLAEGCAASGSRRGGEGDERENAAAIALGTVAVLGARVRRRRPRGPFAPRSRAGRGPRDAGTKTFGMCARSQGRVDHLAGASRDQPPLDRGSQDESGAGRMKSPRRRLALLPTGCVRAA